MITLQDSLNCLDPKYVEFIDFFEKKYGLKYKKYPHVCSDIGVMIYNIKRYNLLPVTDLQEIYAKQNACIRANRSRQYEEQDIKSEADLIKYIIEWDYYSNWYTDNNGLAFNSIFTLLKFREKCEKSSEMRKIKIKELPWDNWDDYPRIARLDLRAKKRKENSVIMLRYNYYGTNSMYELSYEEDNIISRGFHGVVEV